MDASASAIGHDLLNRCRWDGNERQVHRRAHGADAGKGRQAIDLCSVRMNGVELASKSSPLQIGKQCRTHTIAAPRHPHHGDRTRVEKGAHALGCGDALALSAGGSNLGCFSRREGDMEDAGVEGALHRETARLKDLQHAIILTQHIRLEGVDTLPPGNGGQMFEEERAHASPLMGISHGKRHLGMRGGLPVLIDPKIAAHAYNVLLLPFLQRRDECYIPVKSSSVK